MNKWIDISGGTKCSIAIFILFLIVYSGTLYGEDVEDPDTEDVKLKISSFTVSSREIITIANDAIDRSFRNIANSTPSTNFPDDPGPGNLAFPRIKEREYNTIYGYSFSDNDPGIVTFLISPGDPRVMGDHLAVVIDLRKMQALKVYNYPGS